MTNLPKYIRDGILRVYEDLESEGQLRDTMYEDFVGIFVKHLGKYLSPTPTEDIDKKTMMDGKWSEYKRGFALGYKSGIIDCKVQVEGSLHIIFNEMLNKS